MSGTDVETINQVSYPRPGSQRNTKVVIDRRYSTKLGRATRRPDHVYINVIIYNAGVNDLECSFDYTQTQSILENPEDWQVCVVRLEVPTTQIPLFIYVGSYYVLTLEYQGSLFPAALGNPIGVYDSYPYQVNYVTMVLRINAAFATAFAALKTAFSGFPGTHAPYIQYDGSALRTFSLVVDQSAWQPDLSGGGLIWFNFALQILFPGFPWNSTLTTKLNAEPYSPQGLDAQLIVADYKNNAVTIDDVAYWQIDEQFACLDGWDELQSVALTTNMPISPEVVPVVPNIIYANGAGNVVSGSAVVTGVVLQYALNGEFYTPLVGDQVYGLGISYPSTVVTAVQTGPNAYTITLSQPAYVTTASNQLAVFGSGANQSTGQAAYSSILTDFTPIKNPMGRDKSPLQYFANVYRWADFKGQEPLRRLSGRAVWTSEATSQYPIFLKPGEIFETKFQCRRKCDADTGIITD